MFIHGISSPGDIGFSAGTNATATGYINKYGYNEGQTQFRNLEIDDGKGNPLMAFDGASKLISEYGPVYKDPGQGYYFHEDFEDCPDTGGTSVNGNQMYYKTGGTGGTPVVDLSIDTAHPVLCKLQNNSTSDAAYVMAWYRATTNAGNRYVGGGMVHNFEAVIRTGTLPTSGKYSVGFYGDASSTKGSNSIFVEYDPATSSGFWRIGGCYAPNGCATSTSSIAIAANTYYKIKIIWGSDVKFGINNVSAGSITATNTPTGAGTFAIAPGAMNFNTGKNMWIDYIDIYSTVSR